MATYNGGKYIKEQVDSILNELGATDELIISDDGSTDHTISILESYKDSRIKILRHDKVPQKYMYGYTASNFENALRYAKGDYIFLSDQDDVWVKGKVEAMVAALQTAAWVLSDCSYVDSNLQVLVPSKFEFERVKIGVWRNLLYKCGYLGSSMAFRREVLKYALPFPKNVPHDMWIGLTAPKVGKLVLLPQSTMLYRRHDHNVSATNNNLLNKQQQGAATFQPNNHSLRFKLTYRAIALWAYLRFCFSCTSKVDRKS